MTAHKRRHTTQPFALCKLSYAVLLQDAYQHVDVVFLYSNSETFCLSSLPLAIGYFSPRQSRGPSSSQYLFAVKIRRTACAVKARL